MKRSEGQFPTCDSCGREIRGESNKVSMRNGGMQEFHKDAHGCASSPEPRSAKILTKDGKSHTPNYSTAAHSEIMYHGETK